MKASNPNDPLMDLDPDKGWHHDDEATGFCGYSPPLTRNPDDGTTDRMLEEMRESYEREAYWNWQRENSPIEDKQGDYHSGTKNEDEERGPYVVTVLLKWKALKQKIQRLIDRAARSQNERP